MEASQARKISRVGKDTCRYIIERNMRSNGSLLQIINFFFGLFNSLQGIFNLLPSFPDFTIRDISNSEISLPDAP